MNPVFICLPAALPCNPLHLSPSSGLRVACNPLHCIVTFLPVSTFVSQLWTAVAASALQSFVSELWTSQALAAECSDIENTNCLGSTEGFSTVAEVPFTF